MGQSSIGRFLGTASVIAVGAFAVATDKIVSTYGSDAVIGPAVEVGRQLAPLGAAFERAVSPLVAMLPGQDVPPVVVETDADVATVASAAVPEGPSVSAPLPEWAPLAPETVASTTCTVGGGAVVIGDVLALRVFERGALAAPDPGAAVPSGPVVFERLDLSGSYTVGSDGAVSLPALGHVDVAGRDLRCVEAEVALAASEVLGLSGTVSASFATRPPILVQGTVRAPGAHVYSPGMTVSRVLAQAGVIEPAPSLSPAQIVSLRSDERELEARSASLAIERARIDAAISGDAAFAASDDAWSAAADILGGDRIGLERDALLAELAAERQMAARAADQVADLEARVAAARDHVSVAERHFDYLSGLHADLAQRLEEGVITAGVVEETLQRVMAAEGRLLDQRDALLLLESDLRLARHAMPLHEAERLSDLTLSALVNSRERAGVRDQLLAVRDQLSIGDGGSRTFLVTIERSDLAGSERFQAEASTPVLPGDLLLVGGSGAASGEVEVPVLAPLGPAPGTDPAPAGGIGHRAGAGVVALLDPLGQRAAAAGLTLAAGARAP